MRTSSSVVSLTKNVILRRRSSLRINFQRYLSLNPFEAPHLQRRAANFTPLTPLSLYERSVELFPNQVAYIHGNCDNHVVTWGEMHHRVVRIASGLKRFAQLELGDVVSIIAPNTPAMLELHMAIPGIGAVLHTINTRLDASTIAYQLHHSQAKVVLVDSEFNDLMLAVREKLSQEYPDFKVPQFVMIHDKGYASNIDEKQRSPWVGDIDLDAIIASGDKDYELIRCRDEFDAITLNYTSGTTGNPKGVVTHHRGAYLNAIGNLMEWNMPRFSKFLWCKFMELNFCSFGVNKACCHFK
jgi:fatty-acyl-CoA synthase